jgi:hypothetical protein
MKISAVWRYPVFFVLGQVLGCPCCGPAWYVNFARRTYEAMGEPIPPELGGTVPPEPSGSEAAE